MGSEGPLATHILLVSFDRFPLKMGRDGRTPGGGMGAQGMEGAQAWERCTVEGFGQRERDQRQQITEGRVKCIKD